MKVIEAWTQRGGDPVGIDFIVLALAATKGFPTERCPRMKRTMEQAADGVARRRLC
jgi:hypothetical protein